MTYNPLTQDDILNRAGTIGYNASLINNQPEPLTTYTTGGGDVNFGSDGATINPGSTTGDVAKIYSWDGAITNEFPGKVYFFAWFQCESNTPFSDEFELGLLNDSVNQNQSVYIDFTEEVINFAGTKINWDGSLNKFDVGIVEIVSDIEGGTTTVRLNTEKFRQTETTQINLKRGGSVQGVCLSQSNGDGSNLDLIHVKEAVYDFQ